MKGKFKGTKGAFILREPKDPQADWVIVVGSDRNVVATVKNTGDRDETASNGHMIASAKILYKALRTLLDANHNNKQEAIHMAISAIAQAEGKDMLDKMLEMVDEFGLTDIVNAAIGKNERGGSIIHTGTLNMNLDEYNKLQALYDQAIKDGEKHIDFQGESIPTRIVKVILENLSDAAEKSRSERNASEDQSTEQASQDEVKAENAG